MLEEMATNFMHSFILALQGWKLFSEAHKLLAGDQVEFELVSDRRLVVTPMHRRTKAPASRSPPLRSSYNPESSLQDMVRPSEQHHSISQPTAALSEHEVSRNPEPEGSRDSLVTRQRSASHSSTAGASVPADPSPPAPSRPSLPLARHRAFWPGPFLLAGPSLQHAIPLMPPVSHPTVSFGLEKTDQAASPNPRTASKDGATEVSAGQLSPRISTPAEIIARAVAFGSDLAPAEAPAAKRQKTAGRKEDDAAFGFTEQACQVCLCQSSHVSLCRPKLPLLVSRATI